MSGFAKVKKLDLGIACLDIYLLPTGEERIEIESTGVIIGNPKYWIATVTSSPSAWLDRLKERGFTGEFQDVYSIDSKEVSTTISVKDFTKLVTQEAIDGNSRAIVILCSLAEIGIERLISTRI